MVDVDDRVAMQNLTDDRLHVEFHYLPPQKHTVSLIYFPWEELDPHLILKTSSVKRLISMADSR
jgi:hypothetical protein